METDVADLPVRHPVPRRRLTVAEYHRLGEAGILGEGDRVKLLEGQLVQMAPIGPRHALVVDALMYALDAGSEPQPDVAVVRRPWRGFPDAHPGPEDILLLIEVADSSLETDRGAKLEMYAKAGIPEFWIVDLTSDVVIVHHQPSGVLYESVTTVMPSETLALAALPGVSFAATRLFARC